MAVFGFNEKKIKEKVVKAKSLTRQHITSLSITVDPSTINGSDILIVSYMNLKNYTTESSQSMPYTLSIKESDFVVDGYKMISWSELRPNRLAHTIRYNYYDATSKKIIFTYNDNSAALPIAYNIDVLFVKNDLLDS